MKISTKGRYGVRFMMDMAYHEKDGNVTLGTVARRQDISEKYLWQVVNPLKKKGLILAVAGPRGGYRLARAATDITLRDILEVLEGENALVSCAKEPAVCQRSNACASREVWKDVDKKIAIVLDSITLADMNEKQLAMSREPIQDFSI